MDEIYIGRIVSVFRCLETMSHVIYLRLGCTENFAFEGDFWSTGKTIMTPRL